MGRVMDKDSIILKYEQEEMKDAERTLEEISEKNDSQSERLDDMQEKIKQAYAMLGKKPIEPNVRPFHVVDTIPEEIFETNLLSYDELFVKAKNSLVDRGLDVENMDYHDLVSQSELDQITRDLNRPLPRHEKWCKGDFAAVFIAASIGSLADIVLSNRNNKLTGKDSAFSEWLNQFHQHAGGGPIDYQGKGFGGGYHRGLSRGHDILRFIEGIMMFKNGEFVGIRHQNGEAIKVVSKVNQYGTPYEQLSTIEAIVKYAQHMFADLLSTCSLPFPGSSFLAECDNRQLRKFAADMYQNGFNCKNVIIQSISTIIIEVIIRIYFSIQSVKQYKEEFEISDDYSNLEAFRRFFKPVSKEKLNEMLLVAHAIVTTVNVGKVVIKKSPWEINVTEIFSVIKYGVKVMKITMQRHSEYAKLIKNSEEIHQKWQELEGEICYEKDVVNEMTEVLVI